MNYETICNPVPGAEVDGFNFFRDQNGTIVARCCWCMIGFDVTAENAATIRPMMIMHLDSSTGCVKGADRRFGPGGRLVAVGDFNAWQALGSVKREVPISGRPKVALMPTDSARTHF